MAILQNVLALSADLGAGSDIPEQPGKLMPGDVDAALWINRAIREGLAGFLYKNLQKSGALDTLGAEHQQTLRAFYYHTLRFNLKLIHNLKQILFRTNQHNIQIVILQGVDLLLQIYNDVGLRPVSDIDLWVLEKDYPALIHILKSLNYKKDPLYPLTFRKESTVLDLHTHILWANRIKARKYLLAKHQDYIYLNTQTITVDGFKVRCLGQYDRIIYLSLHLLKHNAERLIWLVDIKHLVEDWKLSDWQALLMRARELGQEKCVAQTFFLIGSLLGFQMPEEIYAKLVPLNPIEKKLLRLRQKKGSLPEWSTLILFSSGKRPFRAMLFILETLFPRPNILRQVFAETPGLSVPQLYTRRFFQLAGRAVTSLIK